MCLGDQTGEACVYIHDCNYHSLRASNPVLEDSPLDLELLVELLSVVVRNWSQSSKSNLRPRQI